MSNPSLADLKGMSRGEVALWSQLQRYPGFEREFRFTFERKWRFDFGHPGLRLLVEVDGGAGHHAHGAPWSRENDYLKRNYAAVRGWTVLVGSTRMAEDGRLFKAVQDFIRGCE